MINAIKYMDDLIETGFTQEQAKTTVSMWMELMNENLATKEEFKALELSTKIEFKALENEIKKLETKMDQKFAEMKFSIVSILGSIIIGSTAVLGFFLKYH